MKTASYDLSFLCFRLDFNEYYESLNAHRQQAQKADGEGADADGAGASPLPSPTTAAA